MQLNAYRKLNLELDRIELLYHSTVYSYNSSIKSIGVGDFDNDLNDKNRIEISKSENSDIQLSRKRLKAQYEKKLPRDIRELIFIRAISILEVYMVSQVRELFLKRKDLFHSNEQISFARGELLNSSSITELWTKLINKELRNLQNRSLSEKSKYYSKYLNINFDQSSEYPLPQEQIHDIRHIIVHRLGKTDAQFRRKYKTELKFLSIDETDLEKAINSIRIFAEYIFNQATNLLMVEATDDSSYIAKAHIKVKKGRVRDICDYNYNFIDDESLIWCSDFIKKVQEPTNNEFHIEMQGDKKLIFAYFRLLTKLRNGNSIDIIDYYPDDWRNCEIAAGRKLTSEEIVELSKNLPVRPWQKDIHKRIAIKLNTSNGVISRAITKILSDHELEILIGQDVKYS